MNRLAGAPQGLAEAFNVSRESLERLSLFVELLLAWNAKINLIGPSTTEHVWMRHIADCLQIIPLLPDGTRRMVDLGSGAGLPGLVLAIAGPAHVDLIESNGKKCAFLREAARRTGAHATVHALRVEDFHGTEMPQVVTARAVAPLPRLLELAAPFLSGGAIGLFHKGADLPRELTESAKYWRLTCMEHLSRTDPRGIILEVKEAKRVAD